MRVAPVPAHAYEFWLRAQTIGQAYQLRDYRLVGPDLFLGRRRYHADARAADLPTSATSRRRAALARLPERGLRISWQSYLRVDHDFGDYTSGRDHARRADPRATRSTSSPSSPSRSPALDLMYGYLAARRARRRSR